METVYGWLFGLTAPANATELRCANVTIRRMSNGERQRISAASQDFFAKDQRVWSTTLDRFPFVFEKKRAKPGSVGGTDTVAVMLSLLARGEVRTPITWSTRQDGTGAGASDMQVIDYFYRFANSVFQTVDFSDIQPAACKLFDKLGILALSEAQDIVDRVLIDRIFESKKHPLQEPGVDAHIIARAADVCIGLECLYSEGPGEIQFKIAISLACLLETDPTKRESLMTAVRDTYGLRSKLVHGFTGSKPLKPDLVRSVICADWLLRRSLITQLLSGLHDDAWTNAFKRARLGVPVQIDVAEWVRI